MFSTSSAEISERQPASDHPPDYSGSHLSIRPRYICLSLNRTDTLRLINCLTPTVERVRQTILVHWPRGFQNERTYHGAHEFQLKGNPWRGEGSDAVPSRQLMCQLLADFHHDGWVLVGSTDVSKKVDDKDCLFFRTGTIPSAKAHFFTVSFNEYDKIRLIGSSDETIHAVRRMLGAHRIQNEQWLFPDAVYEGYLWLAAGSETVAARLLLLQLLDVLAAAGYELHAAVDMSCGMDIDTWFMRKDL
ncbi:hypothetical protein BKA62DRAFT_688409 [Auriculariales sp. MPI-PUGE-AT-0066]|nr:hypothetical protein BKA62DRAFT_688409 [Auriculariales sp. MPI-PUGE-AT-0066]